MTTTIVIDWKTEHWRGSAEWQGRSKANFSSKKKADDFVHRNTKKYKGRCLVRRYEGGELTSTFKA